MQPLLEIENLCVQFGHDAHSPHVVDNASLHIMPGETVALVGESGCGKSVTALATLGLLDSPGRVTRGSVRLAGQELIGASEQTLRSIRGRKISMIFQEPMSSLNPVFSVGEQICEALFTHTDCDKQSARAECLRLLDQVGIPAPQQRIDNYPHELSGGMKQRAMIAMALACKPELLVADEPTTALDVTVQRQILDLLRQLQADLGMAILLITHNLGVVAQFASRVLVMYAGNVVESADVRSLFASPKHPYTNGLLASLPNSTQHRAVLAAIAGTVPNPVDYAEGCRFVDRCSRAMTRCAQDKPQLTPVKNNHEVACWLHNKPESVQ